MQQQRLKTKIKRLNELLWENQTQWPAVEEWLQNFTADTAGQPSEQLNALHLLSQFMYFGGREMRGLLHAMYRDLYRYPIIEHLRRGHQDTTEGSVLQPLFDTEKAATRFLGVGNPAESGTHLLYYFRQENQLDKELFINPHEIYTTDATTGATILRYPSVSRYVFLDDMCGSGKQARAYSKDLVVNLKRAKADAQVCYYVLFGTTAGLDRIRTDTQFDRIEAVVELDETFKCFSNDSRYFSTAVTGVDKAFAKGLCERYGALLWPGHPLGYDDGQLLLGFQHNTPDNTLPVFWYEYPHIRPWRAIFKRYPKLQWS